MSTLVHRPVRATVPAAMPAPTAIEPPPQLPQAPTGGVPVQALLPILGSVSSMVMMAVSRGSNPVFMVVGSLVFVVALVSGLAMTFTQRAKATRSRQLGRDRYLDYLEDIRVSQAQTGAAARKATLVTDPPPPFLPQIVADPARVWERRPQHEDFLRLRLGSGNVPWLPLTAPVDKNPLEPVDPLMLAEAGRVARTCSVVDGMPLWCDLSGGGDIALIGSRAATANAARALIAQLATFHAPDDARVAIVVAPEHVGDWAGITLLPHARAGITPTGVPRFLLAPSMFQAQDDLADDIARRITQVSARRHSGGIGSAPPALRRLILFLDEHGRPASPFPLPQDGYTCADLGITVVHLVDERLDEPTDLGVRVTLGDEGQVRVERLHPAEGDLAAIEGWADQVSPALMESLARDIAPLTLSATADDQAHVSPEMTSTLRLLGIPDIDGLSPATAWHHRDRRDFLRVPIGVDDHGSPLLLDIKESAQLGMGPHGICIGATGSGKSELLRTLVLSLAVAHSPEDLSMVLVDFKGGAAFAPFATLPHVAGLIDNLADDPQLTRRARESIEGEVVRRQEMLKQANSAPSINYYRQMREQDPSMPPMPHLFLVIDEFGELLTAEPDFSPLLLKIGRIGRSIGVHLLLASQRLESGMLRGLDTYLSYWIGMRTFSEAESRAILNTPDAFTLPAAPGFGYLKVDTSIYTRFRAGYVSAPVREVPADEPETAEPENLVQVVPLFDAPVGAELASPAEEQPEQPEIGRLLVDDVVSRLVVPNPARPVWLPPLPARVTLGSILSDDVVDTAGAGVIAAIGLLDDPAHQRQGPWLLDLNASGGHVAVVGAPQSGRSTLLRTIAVSLAVTHTPKQVSIYGIDLVGGGLERIEGFPHVGGVATRSDRARLVRLFEEVEAMIATRETVFRTHRLDSMADLRAAHARGLVPQLVAPDVVMIVNGVEAMRNEFEELDAPFTALLQRGGTFGIHVVMALTRWNELRMNVQPVIGQRFETRLNDAGESSIQRAAAEVLKSAGAGRVLTQSLLYAQVALPVLDDVDDAKIGEAMSDLATRITEAWEGPSATPIRLLPQVLDPGELPDVLDMPDTVPFGLRQDTFGPVAFDPNLDQHLLVFGDSLCGKTTLLRGVAREFMRRLTPEELVFAVIDPRRSLAGEIPEDYLGGQAAGPQEARALCDAISAELEQRSSGSGSFPRVVVLVDDYDIIAAGGNHPLGSLLPYLPSARDLKLNVILARPVAGSGRALFDAAIQAIRDTGGSGLVMSGERSEGAIFPKVFAEQMVPGRARFVRRGAPPRLIQIANFPPEATHAD